jgi:acid phosphatase (class A)
MMKPMSKSGWVLLLTLMVVLFGHVLHAGSPSKAGRYLEAGAIDIGAVLPDPPANDAVVTRSDIERMLVLQAGRTPEDVKHLNEEGVFSSALLTSVMGISIQSNSLPATDALLRNVGIDAKAVISEAKGRWKRSRPWVVDGRIQPCIEKPTTFSYPSDRAAQCYVWAVVLSELFPEHKEALMAKAERISQDRVLSGVHFPCDIDAGKKLGRVIVEKIKRSPLFKADFAAAQSELMKSSRP